MTQVDSSAIVANAMPTARVRLSRSLAARPLRATYLLTCLIVMTPALYGCAVVVREHYFAPESPVRERMPIPGSGEGGAVIHASIGPTRVVFESQGARFTAGPDITEGKAILAGPLLPILPGFLFNWIGDKPKEVLTIVSFRITPAGHTVTADLDGITLRTSQTAEPLLPRRYMVTAERSRDREELWLASQEWRPGESHRVDLARGPGNPPPTFRVVVLYPFDARAPQSVEIEWGGLVVDGQDVAPFKASFARRTGWLWGLVGP